MATLLITGGAGFIGSCVDRLFRAHGYETVVIDDLRAGVARAVSHEKLVIADVGDGLVIEELFRRYAFDGVVHLAASTDVGESVQVPDLYYRNNVVATLTLLEAMVRHGVSRFLFSSSAAIFGEAASHPIHEEAPKSPINPYGESKWIAEQMAAAFVRAYGLQFCALRYFNAAGADSTETYQQASLLRQHNLMPRLLRNVKQGVAHCTLFGDDYPTTDGSCIRDYIHVVDLARAHLLAMEQLLGQKSPCSKDYNLGNSVGFSVRQVMATVEKVTGSSLCIERAERRPGDPPCLVADSSKAERELGWKPLFPSLERMVQDQWRVLCSLPKSPPIVD